MIVALLLLDLDRFKDINDALGHPAGDELLVSVADRLNQCMRETDTISRIGGDEFTVILPALCDKQKASRVAGRIFEALFKPFRLRGKDIFVSASMGIAFCPSDGSQVDELLQNADIALHRAKERGRKNFQFFSREMNIELLRKIELEADLRTALERNELELYYQPLVDFETGRIVCTEALLRWHRAAGGPISPESIVRLAEETDLITPLGEWILRTACRQAKAWQRQGLPAIPVAANISGRQLMHSNFAQAVIQILEETELEPRLLELELTESVAMRDTRRTREAFRKLRNKGMRIAIDDFGTAYSSLSYLKFLLVDKIKIDKSFVRDIEFDRQNEAVVTAILALSHALQLEVVAEGIENKKQFGYLWAFGCNVWQGYFFSPPLPPEEFTKMLRGDRRAFSYRFRWSPDLTVGVESIDSQHKGWLTRVNELCKSILAGKGAEELADLITFLTDYTRLHFSDEERLMLEDDFPGYDEHKQAHQRLTEQVQELRRNQLGGTLSTDSLLTIVTSLHDWFSDHMKEMDQAVGEHLRVSGTLPQKGV